MDGRALEYVREETLHRESKLYGSRKRKGRDENRVWEWDKAFIEIKWRRNRDITKWI